LILKQLKKYIRESVFFFFRFSGFFHQQVYHLLMIFNR
jgi:hypothetical protein